MKYQVARERKPHEVVEAALRGRQAIGFTVSSDPTVEGIVEHRSLTAELLEHLVDDALTYCLGETLTLQVSYGVVAPRGPALQAGLETRPTEAVITQITELATTIAGRGHRRYGVPLLAQLFFEAPAAVVAPLEHGKGVAGSGGNGVGGSAHGTGRPSECVGLGCR